MVWREFEVGNLSRAIAHLIDARSCLEQGVLGAVFGDDLRQIYKMIETMGDRVIIEAEKFEAAKKETTE